MNERSREILNFIRSFGRDKGFPPTIREIGKAFGIASTNGVRYHLDILEKAGHIQRRGRISRGTTTSSGAIPVLGRVAAGQPTLAEQNYDGTLEPAQMFGDPQGLFALRVKGDSMIDAGIHSGDYVIVRQQEQATAGDMVVAMIDDEATVNEWSWWRRIPSTRRSWSRRRRTSRFWAWFEVWSEPLVVSGHRKSRPSGGTNSRLFRNTVCTNVQGDGWAPGQEVRS
jgi:repressor LexA